ncbi:MAG: hypothetical protein PVH19_00385 [Planctomycetia bacterium]|jgi:tetratricopeptide (TPR) repeat protein
MKYLPLPLIVLLLIACSTEPPEVRTVSAVKEVSVVEEVPSWHEIKAEVETQLISGERNLADWMVELRDQEPEDLKSALIKIDLALRLRLDHQAAKAVRQLKKFFPPLRFDTMEDYKIQAQIQGLLHSMCWGIMYGGTGWKTALALLETFPERNPGYGYELLKHLSREGWSDARITQWLEQMRRRAAGHPWPSWGLDGFDRDHISRYETPTGFVRVNTFRQTWLYWLEKKKRRPELFWLFLEARHLKTTGQDKKFAFLMSQLEQAIRKHPTDPSKIIDYMNVWYKLRNQGICKIPEDLNRIADVFRPQRSTDAYMVAGLLAPYVESAKTIKLLEHAIDTPLQDGEFVDFLGLYSPYMLHYSSMYSPESFVGCEVTEVVRQRYQFHIRYELSKYLAVQGEASRARDFAREAFEIAWKNHLFLLWPDLQSDVSSGEREWFMLSGILTLRPEQVAPEMAAPEKIKARLLAEEASCKKDPRYWLRRAGFFSEENQREEAEHAYQKGLEVAKPSSRPFRFLLPGVSSVREAVLGGYSMFLEKNHRTQDAIDLLHKELRTAPPDAPSAERAATRLIELAERPEEDEELWRWLKGPACQQNRTWVFRRLARKVYGDAEKPKTELSKEETEAHEERCRHFFQRLEKITQEDPAKIYGFGGIVLEFRASETQQAIQWLRREIEDKDTDEQVRQWATHALLNAYVEAGDLENVKEMLSKTGGSLEKCNSCLVEKIIDKAIEQNDLEIVMRYWQRLADCSPYDPSTLTLTKRLRELGQGDRIDAYYREVKKKLPEFVVPK